MEAILKLRRFLDAPPKPARAKARAEACELCGAVLAAGHGHVIDLEHRRMMCTCRPCYLLFTHPGASHGKFRSVPQRYRQIDGLTMVDALEIPVGVVFFV